MTNITYIIIALWFLESSCGKNFKHPDPNCVGHLGIKPIVVEDANRIIGTKKFKFSDRGNREKSFEIARIMFNHYANPDWDLGDFFLLWRCGYKGMNNPTSEQLDYATHGIEVYHQIVRGIKLRDLK